MHVVVDFKNGDLFLFIKIRFMSFLLFFLIFEPIEAQKKNSTHSTFLHKVVNFFKSFMDIIYNI